MSWFVVVHSGLMSWFVVVHSGSCQSKLQIEQISVCLCLCVCLSTCLAVCCLCTTTYTQRRMHDVCTNFRDDLDLDELANDLPSDFLDSCINYANSVVE